MTGVLRRGKSGTFVTDTKAPGGKAVGGWRLEGENDESANQGHQGFLVPREAGEGQGADSLSEPPERSNTASSLTSVIWPPDCEGIHVCSVEPPGYGHLLRQP